MKPLFHLITFAFLVGEASANPPADPSKIAEVQQEIAKAKPADLVRLGPEFEKAVQQADLSPSSNIRADAKVVQDGSTKLLVAFGEGKFSKDAEETKVVSSAIRTTLDKLDSLIDENYQEQPGTANVSPPAGIPNAAAGMNPNAISDPKLRQQYLDAIAKEKDKQDKNAQQRETRGARRLILMHIAALDSWREAAGLSKEALIGQFTGEGKSRELLRQMVAPVAASENGASK